MMYFKGNVLLTDSVLVLFKQSRTINPRPILSPFNGFETEVCNIKLNFELELKLVPDRNSNR